MKLLWFVSSLTSLLAGIAFVLFEAGAKSAPQEASGAAVALGMAIIPYTFARSVEGLFSRTPPPEIIPAEVEPLN